MLSLFDIPISDQKITQTNIIWKPNINRIDNLRVFEMILKCLNMTDFAEECKNVTEVLNELEKVKISILYYIINLY